MALTVPVKAVLSDADSDYVQIVIGGAISHRSVVAQPGAASSELISQIIKPIENTIRNVTGVTHITAVASDSVAQFAIEF